MKKVKLSLIEKLSFHREVILTVPDNVDSDVFERALDKAERNEYMDDFIADLNHSGFVCEGYDDDLSSPFAGEVECDEYEFFGEDGDQT